MSIEISYITLEGRLNNVLDKNEIFLHDVFFLTNKYAKTKLPTVSSNEQD